MISPSIIIRTKDVTDNSTKVKTEQFIIKNIGKGPALEIKVETHTIYFTDDWGPDRLKVEFKEIYFLEPGEERVLEFDTFDVKTGKKVNAMNWMVINSIMPNKDRTEDVKFSIYYRNSVGKKYFSHVISGKDGIGIGIISELKLERYLLIYLSRIWNSLKVRFDAQVVVKIIKYFNKRYEQRVKHQLIKFLNDNEMPIAKFAEKASVPEEYLGNLCDDHAIFMKKELKSIHSFIRKNKLKKEQTT